MRIRVKAAGVNFADILARQGLYPDAPKTPCVVGYEVAGIVDATGPDAQSSWIGREVFASTRFGGYADTVVVPETQVFDKPTALTFEQAAAISVNYLTAWQLLVVVGSLAPTVCRRSSTTPVVVSDWRPSILPDTLGLASSARQAAVSMLSYTATRAP